MISEQAFEIVLHQRVEHAQHGRNGADGQHGYTPPVRRCAQEIEEHPRHSVDARLDQHAGHERGNIARRDRMRRRQPNVQRHDASLDAEAEKKQEKRGIARTGRHPVSKPVEAIE